MPRTHESKRKPHNDDAGYVASRKCEGGHVVIYDRNNGGDWIDGDYRWAVVRYPSSEHVCVPSLKQAREVMKDVAAGHGSLYCMGGDPPADGTYTS